MIERGLGQKKKKSKKEGEKRSGIIKEKTWERVEEKERKKNIHILNFFLTAGAAFIGKVCKYT